MTSTTFRRVVLMHYRKYGRHTLPWRKTRDSYAILVSEIMLQQTQVDRVVPYFERWMRMFPTAHSLAQAPLSRVLREWSGLGYNRRAKMLHECAKAIVTQYGGALPKDRTALESLPGVGSYTAGAIRAFAFNESDVFIETNIRAALIHHFFPRSRSVPDTKLIPILRTCVMRTRNPREWYAALMDYGAHIKKQHPNPSRRSRHHVRQKSFSGSTREMRGAILRALTERQSLQPLLGDERCVPALVALEREGMIARTKNSWCIAE